jgi:hypothetical protein
MGSASSRVPSTTMTVTGDRGWWASRHRTMVSASWATAAAPDNTAITASTTSPISPGRAGGPVGSMRACPRSDLSSRSQA